MQAFLVPQLSEPTVELSVTDAGQTIAIPNSADGNLAKFLWLENGGTNPVYFRPVVTGGTPALATMVRLVADVGERLLINVAGNAEIRAICKAAETATLRLTPLENQ